MSRYETYIDDSMSIKQPHDTGFGVTGDTAAESSNLSFTHVLHVRLGNKAWLEPFSFSLNEVRCPLPSRFHLTDFVNTGHSLGQLGFINDSRFARGFDNSTGLINTIGVGGTADIFTRILRINPSKVHGNVAKIENWCESILCEKQKNVSTLNMCCYYIGHFLQIIRCKNHQKI